jgi:hypothetical protein
MFQLYLIRLIKLTKYATFITIFFCNYTLYAQPPVLSCDKMNIIYVGVENPISIAVPGIKHEDLIISFSNNTTYKYVGNSQYYLNPTKSGEICMVNIASKNKKGDYQLHGVIGLRIKETPLPILKIGNLSNGLLNKEIFDTQKQFDVRLYNFDFDAKWEVSKFDVQINDLTINNTGSTFSEQMIQAIKNAPVCSELKFSNILVHLNGSDNMHKAEDITFLIK